MTARDLILQRRAGFLVAAIVGAAGLPGCDGIGPTVCLEMAVHCDAQPNGVVFDAPGKVCVGERFELSAHPSYCSDGSKAVYATSDPDLLVIEGTTAIARKAGTVTVTVLFGSRSATAKVQIEACADASADTGSSTDASTDTGSSTDASTDTGSSTDASLETSVDAKSDAATD